MIRTETNHSKQEAERRPRRSSWSAYWLIVKDEHGPIQVLTLGSGNGKALPVFSFEEEAQIFVWLGVASDEWRVRRTGAGELISVLYGLCASVKEVALDPLPEMVGEEAVGLVSLDRDRFIEHVMARREVYTWT